jgi:response regulator RpfG family c-di-GMP phosphodiesterase
MARDPRPAVQFAPNSVPLTVFLCSTPLDLAKEREYVLREIETVNGGFPRIKLHNENDARDNADWRSNLQRSDLLLLPVGSSYGDRLPGNEISFAEAQYREGCKYRKPCLSYFRDAEFLTLCRYTHGHSTERLLLEDWKNTLEEKHHVRYFESADHLANLVACDLRFILRALEQRRQLNREIVIAEAIDALNQAVGLPSMRADRLSQSLTALERSYDMTLEMFGAAMERCLGQPCGARKRVAAFAIAICRSMQLPPSRVKNIARSAFMSDIGKLAVPGEIWCKAELTDEERAMVRRHPLLGYELLTKISFLQEAAEVTYAIEEHYDGSGYPRGLTGELIPLGARIASLARSFESGLSDSHLPPAQRMVLARRSIEQNAGKRFDPRIVNVFMSVPEQIWADLVAEIDKMI